MLGWSVINYTGCTGFSLVSKCMELLCSRTPIQIVALSDPVQTESMSHSVFREQTLPGAQAWLNLVCNKSVSTACVVGMNDKYAGVSKYLSCGIVKQFWHFFPS